MLNLVKTADGSNTFFNTAIGEHYHSRNGALQESTHVFLNSGLKYYLMHNHIDSVDILEVGFGTGLNFLITADCCTQNSIKLDYTGIEAYPLQAAQIRDTAYDEYVSPGMWKAFNDNYSASLKDQTMLNPYCNLHIAVSALLDFNTDKNFDVLYFDAFASAYQPEMWTSDSLAHAAAYLKPGGVFVTYAITGDLKRMMKSLGFRIEKVPGAAGKREMLRAVKAV